MTIESSTTQIERSIEDVFEKLTQASTYERLMPEDASFRISDESHLVLSLAVCP